MSVVSYKTHAIDLSADFFLKIIKLQDPSVPSRNFTSNWLDLQLTPQPALHLTEIFVIIKDTISFPSEILAMLAEAFL